ncbi:MAG: tetratricopeptide repeat protein [Deltaproteobacteria bacterium]|uniref:Tetratricopeptide repeat protein n=1 Tax=Candidatus Zymogenus saltonus TaxID=2844893 RepID=A0A9D8KAH0_9DELT|nr:tetratricopeptide repeat protein [Candidatus Zymogenus saltonus]
MKLRLFISFIVAVVSAVFFTLPIHSMAETATETLKEGIELANNGKHKKALDLYDRAIVLDPGIAHAYAYRSLTLIQLGRLDGAINDSKKAMELSQDRGVRLLSLSNLGAAYIKKGDYKLAVEPLKELISIDQNDPIPHFLLGEALRGIGGEDSLKKAEESYTKAIELDENYALAYFFRAEVKRRLGDETGADEDLKTACERDESYCGK